MEITVRTGVLLDKLAITYRTNQSKNGTNKNIIEGSAFGHICSRIDENFNSLIMDRMKRNC